MPIEKKLRSLTQNGCQSQQKRFGVSQVPLNASVMKNDAKKLA
jgi:hypothetical protein